MKHLVILIALLFTGFNSMAIEQTDESAPTFTQITWELIALDEAPLLEDSFINLIFDEEGKVMGTAGCNHYMGDYELTDAGIIISALSLTRMMCLDEDIMAQESTYVQMLENVVKVTLDDKMLTLTLADDTTLIFQQAITLTDTQWQLISIGENLVVEESLVTLILGEDGGVGGSGGCNAYGGDYESQNDTISFLGIFSTMMYCMDEDLMTQEISYFQFLQSAIRYEIKGDSLTIFYTEGDEEQKLIFEAIKPLCPDDLSGDETQPDCPTEQS